MAEKWLHLMPKRKLQYGISYLLQNYFPGNQKNQSIVKLLLRRIFNQEFASVLYD
ncbi:hypothetical protein ABH966_001747 [Lysinibacillus sp. RC46]